LLGYPRPAAAALPRWHELGERHGPRAGSCPDFADSLLSAPPGAGHGDVCLDWRASGQAVQFGRGAPCGPVATAGTSRR